MILAVDPSINCSGVALFKQRVLVAADAIKLSSKAPLIDRVAVMALRIRTRWQGWDVVVLEWPQVYTKGSNDRNDLLGLAAVCGAVAGTDRAVCYLPREWAGNIPKSKTGDPRKSPRGRRIASRLSPEELKIWATVTTHDAVDAIGLGLHHAHRLERKRVFPGSV